jgi:putative FmdB family regulatory protein
MPTYEYNCAECGTYGSVHRSYDDDSAPMSCPRCHLQMNRIYSAPGLIFKGGGWGKNA